MKFRFSPCFMQETLSASVNGDILTLNGQLLDFSPLQNGDLLPITAIGSKWVASDVERINGIIHITLLTPHGANAPRGTLFPENFDTYLTVMSGPVPIPAYEVHHD